MGFPFIARAFVVASLAGGVALVPARALVTLTGGTSEVMLNSALAVGFDSNLFANAGGGGDMTYALSVGLEYTRNAGLIGLKTTATLNATRYGKFTEENFNNPAITAELTKKTGRTKGSLKLEAARESRADAAVNVRSESWHYDADLNVRYPVNDRYSFLGNLGYSRRDFTDNTLLSDLNSTTAGLDLAYALRTGRDLLAGYYFRQDDTSALVWNTDHAFLVGVSGQILPRLTGTVRAGYEVRTPHGGTDGDFSSWTAHAAVTWNYNQRLNVTAQLTKDFSTTATTISTDTLSSALKATYALNAKVTFAGGTGWSDSNFLGKAGDNRHDNSWTWDASATYILNHHLNVTLSYLSLQNWSTLAFADFTRRNVALILNARF